MSRQAGRFLVMILIAALLLSACTDEPEATSDPAPARPTSAAQTLAPTTAPSRQPDPVPAPPDLSTLDYEASLAEGDCPAELDEFELDGFGVVCAYLSVPEDRNDPEAATIELAVAIIPSRSANPRPDPIIYLEGGPGGSAMLSIADWIDSELRDEYELILFDQRGTGLSLPSLNCIEMELAEDDDASLEAAEECRDRLLDEGVNLSAYSSAANAADVADLIEQLGYEQVNLFGISYGTRLAMTVMRNHPERIRSVILDSPYPPNVYASREQALHAGRAIQAMLRGCAADPECDDAFPDLEARFYDLVDRLNEEPVLVEVEDVETGETDQREVTGDDLVSQLSDWLYVTDLISYMPLMIHQLEAENDTDALRFLFEGGGGGEDFRRQGEDDQGDISDSEAMFYALECREESAFSTMDEARELAEAELPPQLSEPLLASVESFFAMCDIWQVDSADPSERAQVRSDLPTLVLAGEYDPVTPPVWGEIAAEGLSRSFFYVLPAGGHAVVDASTCMLEVTKAFLNQPTRDPNTGCVDDLYPLFAYELP
ncbi:MAG: alpha/beta fold hydrolase [Oscillochloridaceae bacterium umkhey_bin13]